MLLRCIEESCQIATVLISLPRYKHGYFKNTRTTGNYTRSNGHATKPIHAPIDDARLIHPEAVLHYFLPRRALYNRLVGKEPASNRAASVPQLQPHTRHGGSHGTARLLPDHPVSSFCALAVGKKGRGTCDVSRLCIGRIPSSRTTGKLEVLTSSDLWYQVIGLLGNVQALS